jgi:hypothetical protein
MRDVKVREKDNTRTTAVPSENEIQYAVCDEFRAMFPDQPVMFVEDIELTLALIILSQVALSIV